MYRDDVHILRQILLERILLWRLDASLACYRCADLSRWAIFPYDSADSAGLDGVDDQIGEARDRMSVP